MPVGSPHALARLARHTYLEALRHGAGELIAACAEGARNLASQSAEPALYARRRDLVLDLPRFEGAWRDNVCRHLDDALRAVDLGESPPTRPAGLSAAAEQFSLVDDAVIELDMMVSRLAQTVADRAGWEYTDLTSRLSSLEQRTDGALDRSGEVLKPAVWARWVLDAWMHASLGAEHWKTLQTVVHDEVAHLAELAYHEANRVLLEHGVRPEIDLRPFIRRAKDVGVLRPLAPSPGVAHQLGTASAGTGAGSAAGSNRVHTGAGGLGPSTGGSGGYDETRLMTQAPGLRGPAPSQAVLGKLNQLVARQVPDFDPSAPPPASGAAPALASALGQAIDAAQQGVREHADTGGPHEADPQRVVRELQTRKVALKQAAASPAERATIEIVALLFQSILTEERLPASVRVWFARLQMPVLRVAVSEPDFFATLDHPARMLIDRMGSCVMGFVGHGDAAEQDALHKEIKRVVQTIEAYPDTGRRVFQTVLIEFEKFLEHYFREGNEASRKSVSLAQQVEQREALAIQYTIELRKMLQDVPVHEGIRDFLFKVWADVLALSAVQTSASSEETRACKRLAGDLIWSASAKTTREERNEVLQRLPPLLKALRAGMGRAGLDTAQQDQHIHTLNTALSAAFTAKSAALSSRHLQDITRKLEALDEVLPEMGEVELDADLVRDLSGYERDDIEVVGDGGTMPTPAMLAWARELKLGSWFQLDYRGRQEPVQLAWRGLQRHLLLFVTPAGRSVLFQVHRLAAFLQAGLLVPAEEESLTVRATRDALAKLDADPERLLN